MGLDKLSQGFQLPDGSIVQVNIMDTAGQERYDSLNSSYYKNADCCILVYDITNRKTFDKITNYYISKIKENSKNIKKKLYVNEIELKDIITSEENEIDEEKRRRKADYDLCRTMTIMSNLRETTAS